MDHAHESLLFTAGTKIPLCAAYDAQVPPVPRKDYHTAGRQSNGASHLGAD